MAYDNKPRISRDRFNRPFQLKLAGQAQNRKSGEVFENIYVTRFELGGKKYQIDISHANKTKKDGRSGVWVKITLIPPMQKNSNNSM